MFRYIDQYNVIRGHSFKDIADVDISMSTISVDIVNILHSKNCIIFCKTDFIQDLFTVIYDCQYSHVLITHNSDYGITQDIYSLKPLCIKFWYGQNMCVNYDDCCGIPIGLENFGVYRLNTKYQIMSTYYNNMKKENMCYLNVNIDTNPSVRLHVVDLFKFKDFVRYNLNNLSFEQYVHETSRCKYVISPEGNGIDCHRVWEALYLGCIPIIKRHTAMNYFNSLPIIYVDNWQDLTMEYIESYDISNKNVDMITMDYWKNEIILKYRMICDNSKI